jgi:hypothetical protein
MMPCSNAVLWVGIDHAHQPRLGHWIDGDDCSAVPFGRFERRQHARVVCSWIVAENENRVALIEVIKRHRSLADANGFGESGAARLVAHIGTIGQIVGPELPRKQLEQKRGFIACFPRRIEDGFVRPGERAKLRTDESEGVAPFDGLVMRTTLSFDHWDRQASLGVQPII